MLGKPNLKLKKYSSINRQFDLLGCTNNITILLLCQEFFQGVINVINKNKTF